jgi:hypothetical protein
MMGKGSHYSYDDGKRKPITYRGDYFADGQGDDDDDDDG